MTQTFKVPIRNLFYLLSYAHNMPDLIQQMSDVEDDVITLDFLGQRFNQEVERIMKRGLLHHYVEQTQETNRIGGRIVFNESLTNIMQNKSTLVCEKDEFTQNVLLNQILKTTLEQIYKHPHMEKDTRRKSFHLWERMPEVDIVYLTREMFIRLSFSRLTAYYKTASHLARLLHEMKLLSHKTGEWSLFMAELNEYEMNDLFELFLKNFYTAEQHDYTVKSELLDWGLEGEGNEKFLPKMKTDVSMMHKVGHEKIIIDAKFYENMFQQNKGKSTFHSAHMYQMLAYLMHQSRDLNLRGILIYPFNGENVQETYRWDQQTTLEIRTLNLDDPWPQIYRYLISIVGDEEME